MELRETLLTEEGLISMKNELAALIARRPEIAERLKVAREMGDLSENAEYAAAREEQGHVEGRITELEILINTARVIDSRARKQDRADLGSMVGIIDLDGGTSIAESFRIVGTAEADALAGRISDVCPVGAALLGKRAGTELMVTTPDGPRRYRLVRVS